MNRLQAWRSIGRCIDGWREGNKTKILDALAESCVVIESYGPSTRKGEGVAVGGRLVRGGEPGGPVGDYFLLLADHGPVFEWRFACTWRGKQVEFDGASIASLQDGKILRLPEYCTTAPLYEWEGQSW